MYQILPLRSDLHLFKLSTGSQDARVQPRGNCRLDRRPSGASRPVQIGVLDPAGAENVAVGEVLGGEVADSELGEDDVGTGFSDVVQFLVDDICRGDIVML